MPVLGPGNVAIERHHHPINQLRHLSPSCAEWAGRDLEHAAIGSKQIGEPAVSCHGRPCACHLDRKGRSFTDRDGRHEGGHDLMDICSQIRFPKEAQLALDVSVAGGQIGAGTAS
jgi:hypothetical protein